jgi:Flp pilus assembly pilin Flp
MDRVLPIIDRLVRGDEGQDLLEYGLLAVLIAVVAITGVQTLGETIRLVFWEAIANGF